MIFDIPFLYVISTAEVVWLRSLVRCYVSWPTINYPSTRRAYEDAEFLSNIAFLYPGTKLVLPQYELGGLQLVPLFNCIVLNLSSFLGINNDYKKPVDLHHERIVAIYCRRVAFIGHKFIIRCG
jgi:hypothetical protein